MFRSKIILWLILEYWKNYTVTIIIKIKFLKIIFQNCFVTIRIYEEINNKIIFKNFLFQIRK